MDPARIGVRVLFAYIWALILVRISGKRTIRGGDVPSFIVAVVIGDMFDDLFWAEVSMAQFVIGLGALMLAHLGATITRATTGGRIWRRDVSEALQ
jgi:uncharacterized membrane protein YcaP (DUF421 family)